MESGERLTTELWVEFGGLRRSEERTRACWSELATVSPLRPRFWRERARQKGMDASTSPGVSLWRSCARWELTSWARSNVRAPNVDGALSPVGHVDELGLDSVKVMIV